MERAQRHPRRGRGHRPPDGLRAAHRHRRRPEYREALNATGIRGGIAGNVIPDECVVTVNYRYALDRSEAEAAAHVEDLFTGFEVDIVDNAGGARPGLDLPAARAFVEALGVEVVAKEGWTDVARFSELGIAAVNFGPGDPNLAHHDDERCPWHSWARPRPH